MKTKNKKPQISEGVRTRRTSLGWDAGSLLLEVAHEIEKSRGKNRKNLLRHYDAAFEELRPIFEWLKK